MRTEKLERLVTSGMLGSKRSKCKSREKMAKGMTQWCYKARVTVMLKIVQEKDKNKAWHHMMISSLTIVQTRLGKYQAILLM